ncbi:MAG: recombinase family protein, partial [Dehalococcoidia bacterium]|nr:recombinase family protein [Dehalococcoidia bacterium]
ESTKNIVQSLKDSGMQTNQKRPPSYSFIACLLKNRRYLGEYRFRDVVIENSFASLVDEATFEKCQERLQGNQRRPGHFKPIVDKYALTGKSFCGYCGSTITGESANKKNAIHRYYHCRVAKIQRACENKRVRKKFLELGILYLILYVLHDDECSF